MTTIRLGISTCPNDTFAFHGILTQASDPHGLTFQVELMDVEELNAGLTHDRFDVAKASFATALRLTREWGVLPSGSALGFGVGPVLLSASAEVPPDPRVILPGAGTTAAMLYALLRGNEGRLRQGIFSDIMPALEAGQADLGVCIHEGRFTYGQRGLHLVEDLGERWEQETGAPLPLGGILARQDLGDDTLRRVQGAIHASLRHAQSHREDALLSMRRHAQEMDDDVIWQHVELYVNRWTEDLGHEGRASLDALSQRARQARLLDETAPPLKILATSPGADG